MSRLEHVAESTAWYRDDQRAAMDDLWRVWQPAFEKSFSSAVAWASRQADLQPFVASTNLAQMREREVVLEQAVQAAMAGDATAYRLLLQRAGATCADASVRLGNLLELTPTLSASLLPLLVHAYAQEPGRLGLAVDAMHHFVAHSLMTVADACLEHTRARTRAREDDLSTMLDSIGDAVIVTDVEANVVRMNPVAEALTGFSFTAAQGKPLADIFRIEHEETHQAVESPILRVLREGIVVGLANHTELVARDGTRRPIADSGAPVRRENGDIRGVILVFRDITQERKAQEALRHWERIFQHATWGVALARTSDVTFQAVNPEYARMHGYTVDELLGAPVSILWTPETHADMERHSQETHEHGRLVAETTHQRKDGSTLPVEIVATTIKDGHGNVAWFVANVQDISERKRIQQLKVRAIELEAQNRRVEEANRLKSEFLANMSHELRTPLNSILGFSELLHDEEAGPVSAQQKSFLNNILTGGRHLLRLINDVLDLAKVEAGKMEFRPELLNVPVLVESVMQGLLATVLDKTLQVDVVVDSALNDVVLDPTRFKQVLYNYVSNALKFTLDGGRVSVRVTPDGPEQLRLEVEDTGIGIAPKDVPRLFMEFQQLDAVATKRYGGTGLGLALTKRLTEAQGGSVGMHPAAERGSVFFAVLPRRAYGVAEPTPQRDYTNLGSTILVVEDDADNRAVLVRTLSSAGYIVDAVSSCSEASAAWKKRRYDAITLSLLLPDRVCMQDLLSLVRDDRSAADVPVIAMTLVTEHTAVAGFAVSDVLTKPVDPGKLLHALERGGILPTRDRPVLVVDDDVGSLKLMRATLARLGHMALCCSDAREALLATQRFRPIAVIVDLIMPEMDGLAFLDCFRASPENEGIPVMVWTIKDLTADERRQLERAANAVVQKGVDDGSRLFVALRALLASKTPSMESPL